MSITFREFLFYEKKTVTQAAQDLMVSRMHLTSVSLGKTKPSIRLARDIENYTGGQVKAENLINLQG